MLYYVVVVEREDLKVTFVVCCRKGCGCGMQKGRKGRVFLSLVGCSRVLVAAGRVRRREIIPSVVSASDLPGWPP